MGRWMILVLFASLTCAAPLQAGEFRVALLDWPNLQLKNPFGFSEGGGLQLGYRLERSHWQFGYRFVEYYETSEDPIAGGTLTETNRTLSGPILCYFFNIKGPGTGYLGVSYLEYDTEETALLTGEKDTSTETSTFFGGGYQRRFGRLFYWNLGLFVSGIWSKTETSVSMTEERVFDLQAQVGLVF